MVCTAEGLAHRSKTGSDNRAGQISP